MLKFIPLKLDLKYECPPHVSEELQQICWHTSDRIFIWEIQWENRIQIKLKVKKLSFQGMVPLTPFFWLGNHKSQICQKLHKES